MDSLTLVVVAANTVTLVFGSAIVLLAWRAYERTRARSLRALTVGLGLVTLGTLLGGSLHQLVGVPLLQGIALQSCFTAVGFLVLAYSLVAETRVVHGAVDSSSRET